MFLNGTEWRQDVATLACKWMCAFWRVPFKNIKHILRCAIKFEKIQ
jgi:hypothetical protein